MTLAVLASCTKSEVLNQESLKEKAISFTTYVGKTTQTKTTTITVDNSAQAGIGLLAYSTGSNDMTEQTAIDNAPKFMQNLKLIVDKETVSNDDDANNVRYSATYEPERYWPSTGSKVSFFAYAPYLAFDGQGNKIENEFNPQNIDFDPTTANAHLLTLTVDENDFSNHTDFMVAKVGENADGDGIGTDGTTIIGINQNLNKDYDGKVWLQMKHALSKVSFEAQAVEDGVAQTVPYSGGLVKVVIDKIDLVGTFASGGQYNLITENWANSTENVTLYSLTNAEGTNDPFNPIADELYNIQCPAGTEATEENTPNEDGWYKLNKSSHDLMIIPTGTTQIVGVKGSYTVKTYAQAVDANGNKLWEDAEETIPQIGDEITDYRDVVTFGIDENDDLIPFDNAIVLEAGKHYKFRFNIKLKKIEFEVAVEGWDSDESTTHIIVDSNN